MSENQKEIEKAIEQKMKEYGFLVDCNYCHSDTNDVLEIAEELDIDPEDVLNVLREKYKKISLYRHEPDIIFDIYYDYMFPEVESLLHKLAEIDMELSDMECIINTLRHYAKL